VLDSCLFSFARYRMSLGPVSDPLRDATVTTGQYGLKRVDRARSGVVGVLKKHSRDNTWGGKLGRP
jgi:hypothetical protein